MYKLFAENTDALKRRLKRAEKLEGKDGRPVRIWVDGCFDMMHFGHANAFRQAKALGDVLIVGVNTDAEILKYKGAPLMNDHERIVAVSACKWVDEVVTGVPYMMNDEYLNFIFDTYKVDYVVHGDDPCLLPDGSDVYGNVKKLGKFKTIKRTEGVSTTEIVGRMLMMNKDHHVRNAAEERGKRIEELDTETGSFVRHTSFMPTGRRFIQFSNNKSPKSDDVIVYVDGTWDLFHAGHIEFLEQVGLYEYYPKSTKEDCLYVCDGLPIRPHVHLHVHLNAISVGPKAGYVSPGWCVPGRFGQQVARIQLPEHEPPRTRLICARLQVRR